MGDKAEQMLGEFLPALGMAMAGPIAGAAAGAGAAGAAGAGEAAALSGGLDAADVALANIAPEAAAAVTPEAMMLTSPAEAEFANSNLLNSMYGGDLSSLGLTASGAQPMITQPFAPTPFAPGAVTGTPGMASVYGPTTESFNTASKGGISAKAMLHIGKMLAQSGSTPKQQAAPMGDAFAQPSMRPALMTQEEITKKWLRINDPNTYRRIYGEPKG